MVRGEEVPFLPNYQHGWELLEALLPLPPPILEGPREEPQEAQKSGLSPKPSGHNPEPRYWGSEIVVIVEEAGLQGPACFNLVTAPLAGVEEGRQQVPGSS